MARPTKETKARESIPISNAPCPKCRSESIFRRFRKQRSHWWEETKDKNPYATKYLYNRTARVDHITHRCQCCDYRWYTLPADLTEG